MTQFEMRWKNVAREATLWMRTEKWVLDACQNVNTVAAGMRQKLYTQQQEWFKERMANNRSFEMLLRKREEEEYL